MSETLETIAAALATVRRSMDDQFARVDRRFDEMNAQLGVRIEAVDEKVKQVYDAVIAQREEAARNAAEHDRFRARRDNYDIRLAVLEKCDPAP